MAKELALVLNNGSLNSAVLTALAAQKHRPILLNIETTQSTGSRARAAYDQQVGHFKPYREHSLPMPFLNAITPEAARSQTTIDPRQHAAAIGTPLLEREPWQVVDLGFQVNAPFDKTWSCLEEMNEPCWACRGCRGREAAFQQAAKPDPLRVIRKV